MQYRYLKKVGALQEAQQQTQAAPTGSVSRRRIPAPQKKLHQALQQASHFDDDLMAVDASTLRASGPAPNQSSLPFSSLSDKKTPLRPTNRSPHAINNGIDPNRRTGGVSMLYYTVNDGQRVLMVNKDGSMEEIVGPRRVWRKGRRFITMDHYVAHPGEFLILRFRSGEQQHLPGPCDVWLDPRKHVSAEKEEVLPIATKEAVVAYFKNDDGKHERRIINGPATFVPAPGEWLHTFSWHGSSQDADGGYRKSPNALVFQKLWLLPDQMYHDITDVRTADDAVLTVRLMIFFELVNIERMLDATHDPIGDFVNAASSDVVEFVGRYEFSELKRNSDKLNELAAYKQLVQRAEQTGYRINKVVYRGYGAPDSLQDMHDQAIESRTRLGLEKATEEQAQELEDYKLDRELARDGKQRQEKAIAQDAVLAMLRKREQSQLQSEQMRREYERQQQQADDAQRQAQEKSRQQADQQHLETLKSLGVELTPYLTQARADRVIELRGGHSKPHVHLNTPDD